MQVTNYLFDPQYLVDRFKDFKHRYEERNPGKSYEEDLPKITSRYLYSEPTAYIRFGVYWGAVLKALHSSGRFPEIQNNEPIVLVQGYSAPDTDGISGALLTLIAAFEFKDYYNSELMQGTREFEPFDDGTPYVLHDYEFEMHILGID
ncbi:hypothetical protein A1D23_09230 [Chelonobacter oris]|uniref:hypothetical protein n=1 Tax=Chelonobacter oris TaxID=505317 RepID=UPI00244AA738|nr:hypothetical protein [Chelonobacter oris]MDH3000360.1 hypothetical protein [Chelonobacter oris]